MDKKEFTRGNPQEEAPKRIKKKKRRWLPLLGIVLGVLVLPVEAALKTLTYGSTREILRKVDKTL